LRPWCSAYWRIDHAPLFFTARCPWCGGLWDRRSHGPGAVDLGLAASRHGILTPTRGQQDFRGFADRNGDPMCGGAYAARARTVAPGRRCHGMGPLTETVWDVRHSRGWREPPESGGVAGHRPVVPCGGPLVSGPGPEQRLSRPGVLSALRESVAQRVAIVGAGTVGAARLGRAWERRLTVQFESSEVPPMLRVV